VKAPIAKKLDLVSKLYQRSIYPHSLQVARGGRLAAPIVIDLDPTSFCDLACPECISSGVLNKERFSATRLATLAEEIASAGVKAVILIGGGEPLMHTGVRGAMRKLHAAGVKLGLVTNGTLIDRYLDELAEMVSWVRVSMDAATQETYDEFRPSGRATSVYPKVIANIRLLAERKRGRLGYSFLLMQRHDAAGNLTASNYGEVEQAGRLAHELGCDYFEVKAMFDDDHFVLEQAAEDVAAVGKQIASLRDLESDHFRILEAESWRSLRDGRGKLQPKDYDRCLIAELRTTVTPSGVFPCAYHRGNERLALGQVQTMSLTEMWENAAHSKLDPTKDCRFECARHPSNLALMEIGACGEQGQATSDYDFFI